MEVSTGGFEIIWGLQTGTIRLRWSPKTSTTTNMDSHFFEYLKYSLHVTGLVSHSLWNISMSPSNWGHPWASCFLNYTLCLYIPSISCFSSILYFFFCSNFHIWYNIYSFLFVIIIASHLSPLSPYWKCDSISCSCILSTEIVAFR